MRSNIISPDSLEMKKGNFVTILSVVGIALIGVVLAPVVFMLLQMTLAIALMSIIGVTGFFLGPVAIKKLARIKFDALIEEAKKNPIFQIVTTQQNLRKQVEACRSEIEANSGLLKSYESQVYDIIKKTNDQETIKRWNERLAAYRTRLENQREKYKQALEFLKMFDEKVELATMEWDLMLMDKSMMDSFKNIEGDPMENFLTKTAFKEIYSQSSQVFESLRLDNIEDAVFKQSPLNIQMNEKVLT